MIQPGYLQSWLKAFVLLIVVLISTIGHTQTISGETVVLDEDVNETVTTNYLIVKSLTLTPISATEPLVISAATDGNWYAKMIEQTDNTPPTLSKNFVRTEVAREAFTDENEFAGADARDRRVSFSYSDGLGRPIQTVVAQQSPGQNDVIGFHKYDETTGIEENAYLPYTRSTSNPGGYHGGYETAQSNFYSGNSSNGLPNETHPYSHTEIEDSPLGRVKSTTGVGGDWHTNDIKTTYDYFIYDPATHGQIRRWRIIEGTDKEDDEPRARKDNEEYFYVAGELTIVQVTDEEGRISQKITDSRGLSVASRVQKASTSEWVTTYNVYDDFGRLRFTVPPAIDKGTDLSDEENDGFLFKYIYDARGRLIKEKKPGAGWVYHCYDKWDRVVLTSDAVQRANNKWTYFKYDKHNRLIMSGRKNIDTDPDDWWSTKAKNSSAARYENVATDAIGYTTDESLPTVINEIYSITYYDDYDFIDNTGWDIEGINFDYINDFDEPNENTAVKGLTTGSKVKVLDSSPEKWLNTVVYYDDDYREIQIISENHLGGYDRISSDLNWAGELLESRLYHSKNNTGVDLSYGQRYDYDHDGRLLKVWNEIDPSGNPISVVDEVLMAEYQYNELGTLIEKNVHSTNEGSSFLQSIDYRYNAKGWLTSINDPQLSEPDDLFGAAYHYNQTFSVAHAADNIPARYDGSLAAFEWQNKDTDGNNFDRSITGYNYDDLGQLTKAIYATGSGGTAWWSKPGYFDVNIDYEDDNGNIRRIIRNKNNDEIDDLAFTYESNSNQLKGVADNGTDDPYYNPLDGSSTRINSGGGFNDFFTGAADYTYDANGNLVSDLNKQIVEITYNHLQLPESIEFDESGFITYTYDAAGNRLSKTILNANDEVVAQVDYVGVIEYYNDEINQVFTDEGRAYAQNGSFHYEYMITDHQGNNRVSYGVLPERKVYVSDFEDGTDEPDFHVPNNTVLTDLSGQFNHTLAGVKSQHLTGEANKVVGAARVLDIANGDKVSLEYWAKYNDSGTSGTNQNLANAVGSLFTSSVAGVVNETTKSAINSTISANPSWLSRETGSTNLSAYLNYLFFNEDGSVDASLSNYLSVNGTSGRSYIKSELNDLTFNKSGYLYVYLANEQNNGYNVYFDDLVVTHESSNESFRVTQVNEYYPFGALMATSWKEEGYLDPGFSYQSTFADYDSTIATYDFLLRNYDPWLGRWLQTDPYSQFSSPYLGMGNGPHMGTDPDGGFFTESVLVNYGISAVAGAVTGVAYAYLSGRGDEVQKYAAYGAMAGLGAYAGYSNIPWSELGSSLGGVFGPGGYSSDPTVLNGPGLDELLRRGEVIVEALDVLPNNEVTGEPWREVKPDDLTSGKLRDYPANKESYPNFVPEWKYNGRPAPGTVTPTEDPFTSLVPISLRNYLSKQVAKRLSVIGPRATYREYAQKIGANFLNVTDDAWTMRKNVKFLQGVVKRGDDVIFAGKYNPAKLDPSSVLAQEIRYLQRHGYSWNKNFTRLIKQ